MNNQIDIQGLGYGESPGKPAYQMEYEKVLDSMIAAEISEFDREELRKKGEERSRECGGDEKALRVALNSLYNVFLNSINIREEKKAILLFKIDEQKAKKVQALKDEHNAKSVKVDSNASDGINTQRKLIEHKKAENEVSSRKIEGIKTRDIPNIEKIIMELKEKLAGLKDSYIRPPVPWFQFISVTFFNLILAVYLFLFYSSAAYILLFGEADAQNVANNGVARIPAQVFQPHALSLALKHGGTGLLLIIVFPFFPIALALADKFTSHKFWKNFFSYFVGVFFIDGFLAYKITEAIFQINHNTGGQDGTWKPSMVFSEVNLYLVFVMGAACLLIFKFLFDRLYRLFEEMSLTANVLQIARKKEEIEQEIGMQGTRIATLQMDIEKIEQAIIEANREIILAEQEITRLAAKKADDLRRLQDEFNLHNQYYEDMTEIYKGHVTNNKLPVSIDALRDRISLFMEGWSVFLHQHFANALAVKKFADAEAISTTWINEKIDNNLIDKRFNS